MNKPSIGVKKKLLFFLFVSEMILFLLILRVFYIQTFEADFFQQMAYEQQTRDRLITPKRGTIYDRNMVAVADTQTVSSISVIHAQIKEPEKVAKLLSDKLELNYDDVLKKVNKKVALERIKTKVNKEVADSIRALNLPGIIVDEDILRVYPYSTMASQVIGFVGKDNQGIIGLEAKYDAYLKGEKGKILTETDARGVELKGSMQNRVAPTSGLNVVTSIDVIIQQYAEQTLAKVVEAKGAKRGSIILLNPQNGEIYAMASKPDFDLNDPFTINSEEMKAVWDTLSEEDKNKQLNLMWRNFNINDTYEPGSTFKIVTSTAGLEEGVVKETDTFNCPGYRIVGGRTIKCWRSPRSHGTLNFVEGVQNSCNPVFMDVAERLGPETFYKYMNLFGFNKKTGIDLPGEAVGIMHALKNVGPVELATMSFGQSFQITPLQLLSAASTIVNGGRAITPHFVTHVVNDKGTVIKLFDYTHGQQIISAQTSDQMKSILESVVSKGTGNKTYIPGYRVGGKTATSEKLPRRNGKYIASFLAFAPAENPQVLALVLVDEPQGVYYGGQVAGPVMKELLENTLPYLKIEPSYTEEELKLDTVSDVVLPELRGMELKAAKKILSDMKIDIEVKGTGTTITNQFPLPNEHVNQKSKVVLYTA